MYAEDRSFEIYKVIINTKELNRSMNSLLRYFKESNISVESRKIKASFIVKDFLIFRFSLEDLVNLYKLKLIDRKIEEIVSLCSNNVFNCIVVFEFSSINIDSVILDLVIKIYLKLSFFNIYSFISYSSYMTFLLIKNLLKTEEILSKSFSTKKIILPSDYNEKTIALAILQAIPGIGPKRAAKILYEFGSLSELSKHSPFEISSIANIPLNLAEMIYRVLNTKFNEEKMKKD